MAQAKTCGRAGRWPGWVPGQGRRGRTAPRLSHHPGVHCRGISHPLSVHEATDAPLRRDVRLLGDILGRVLVEQEDEALLADVERVRALARAARDGATGDDLAAAVGALPLERQASVLRAFAAYFQLANVAEQQHRIRRHRSYAHEDRPLGDSLGASFARLADVPREAISDRVSLELVLTAHPTEAARRTV